MQQTTKYQFKLIEGSDDFSPKPLNDNVEKVEELFQDMAETVEAVQDAYTPDNKPYVIGSYEGTIGNANGTRTITLGFKPSFLIVCGNVTNGVGTSAGVSGYYVITGGNAYSEVLTLTDTGFTITQKENTMPMLTYSGRTYDYIAFR